ncbi:hypothetical protein FC17_GL003072 [Secundilactobacillus paracollinoides DSM 15502 = JCM 11969]|nr:hypothetical protein FC17_GL003072 [Secundilactobacillus paracollinoides DSM 15502 = JCM 11969]
MNFLSKYAIQISNDIFNQIKSIHSYIADVLYANEAADLRVKQMIIDIRQLADSPDRGFNTDKKMGRQLLQNHTTLGIPIVSGKYIVLYFIDDSKKIVHVIDLLPTKSDYTQLFL